MIDRNLNTDAFLLNLAKRALNKKAHLSFFERQQAVDLGLSKALDANGNLDLNEAANIMTQSPSRRVSPNVLASESTRDGWAEKVNGPSDVAKAMGELNDGHLAAHARFCKNASGQDVQGRNCKVCKGIGFRAHAQRMADKAVGASANKSRHDMGDNGASQWPNESVAPMRIPGMEE